MEEIIKLLGTNASQAIKFLTGNTKNTEDISNLRKEYTRLDRTIRDTQVGKIQKDKTVGEGAKTKIVKGVRIPIPFQKKIVKTATAFEVGKPVSLVTSEPNDLSGEIIRLWRLNRIDNKIQKTIQLMKSELQCALLFTIEDLLPNSLYNRILGKNKKKEIKVRVLENKNGIMTPFFDNTGNMTAFTWQYSTKNAEGKEIKNAWIYDESKVYQCDNSVGDMKLQSTLDHGFGKIPIVYLSQDDPEWHDAQVMIDRLEVSISKLGASNDYAGHPILKLYGDVDGAPEKDEDGKAFILPQKETQDGKTLSADVDFLTYDQAPEAVKLEMDKLEKYIYSLTSTPDISFDNIKGLSNISGVAIKLMFLDAMIKAQLNEGENRTMIERIINVFIAGNIKTTNTSYKSQSEATYFDVEFNSIIPDDIKDTVEMLARAVEAKIMSQKAAVESLAYTDDSDAELTEIMKLNVDINKPKPVE